MNVENTAIQNILANLSAFGLKDMNVIGKFGIRADFDGPVLRMVELKMTLAGMCGDASNFRYKLSELAKGEMPDSYIQVEKDGQRIGYIDSDRQFNFTAAPTLRECLGWAVATDFGQVQLLKFDLTAETRSLEQTISAGPFDEPSMLDEYFFEGAFDEQVQKTVEYHRSSRFADGYCGVKNLFWQVGTRTLLGKEHPGFEFSY